MRPGFFFKRPEDVQQGPGSASESFSHVDPSKKLDQEQSLGMESSQEEEVEEEPHLSSYSSWLVSACFFSDYITTVASEYSGWIVGNWLSLHVCTLSLIFLKWQ